MEGAVRLPTQSWKVVLGELAVLGALAALLVAGLFARDPYGSLMVLQRGSLPAMGLAARTHEVEGLPPVRTFESAENGPTWVFVHGFADQAGSWGTVADVLQPDRHVVLIDLPGHGESAPPPHHALSVNDAVSALEGVINGLSADKVVLVGNSMGGWVTQLYALDHPERVHRLVLVNSAGLTHPLDKRLVLATTEEALVEKMATMSADPQPVPSFILRSFARHFAAQDHLSELFDDTMSGAHFTDERLSELAVPTTLVWGTTDGFFPLDYAERLRAAVPGSQLVLLNSCGHAPQVECPNQLVGALKELTGPGSAAH